jgi:GNAT superfamily N-acetyltransferase
LLTDVGEGHGILEGTVIREVQQGDTADVLQLLRQLWPEGHLDEARIGAIVERYVGDPGYWIYGYEVEGVLRGLVTVSFRWTLFHAGQVAIIEDLVVDEGFKGQGMGTALLDFVENRVVEEGRARTVEVNSDLHRNAAHAFWERHGYARLAYQFRKALV